MTECPELGALEANPLPPELRDHVSSCESCKLVIEVIDASGRGIDGVEDCIQFDALLAARGDGTLGRAGKNLLDRHLASCASCREVAETLSPTQDADGDQASLPEVDPGSYALGLEVARGGMGRVIAARDLRIGRPIAIKELLGRSPQLAARFEREARVTARLQHPGIVPIYEIGKWPDGTPFYSMRMVDGRMLGEAIASAKTLAARLALLPAVIAATEAVAFAHAKRVIHRDLTPSNILVGAYGETVVIDWGLAKDLADADEDTGDDAPPEPSNERLTGVGAVIGTATYMPPEQAHAVPVDERADVYALGAILYHVLAGRPPYQAKTSKELLRAVKTAPPRPIDEVQPGTPRDLVSIIAKAMARDPEHRYPSARELAEELKRFQTGRLVEAHVYSRFELLRRFLRRHRAAVTVSALALVISLSFGAFAVRKILRSNEEARDTVRELILEKGRVELLAGNNQRALAFLYEAHVRGDDGPTLQFLLGHALRGLSTPERSLDCGGNVRAIAFDKTKKYVAAGCGMHARLWRLGVDEPLATVKSDDEGYNYVVFSTDGTTLATWGKSGVARLWDPETGALRASFEHGAEITRLSFTADDKLFATTGYDGLAHVWDVASQTKLRTFVGQPGLHLYGKLHPDGTRLYAITLAGLAKAWNVKTGAIIGETTHGSTTVGGDMSANGERAVTCGADRYVRVWDTTSGEQLHKLAGHTDTVWKCIFSPDGSLVLSGGHDGRADIWDLGAGNLLTSVDHGDIVINADFSPDARRFATIGPTGRVKLWDTRTGAALASLDTLHGKDLKFAPDNQRLVATRGDGRLQVWRFDTQPPPYVPPASFIVDGVSHDGTHVVIRDRSLEGRIEIRNLARKEAARAERLHAPVAIASGAPILAARHGMAVRIVDIVSKQQTRELAVTALPHDLAISADGTRVVVMYGADPPDVWDVATGQRLVTLTGATSALLSRDGRRAVAWQPDVRPVIWNVDTKTAGVTLQSKAVRPIGFARGGSRVALVEGAHPDTTVSLWDADTGQRLGQHPDTSTAPAFDPSGRWLTTIDSSYRVTVWSAEDGAVHAAVGGDRLLQAQVNPQGTLIAAIANYGTVAILMSAADGRILAQWPLDHPPPQISQDEFKSPGGSATWTLDGAWMITQSVGVSVWPIVDGKPKQADRIKRNLQWRFEDGQLARISNGKLSGTVQRDGSPQAGVQISVEIRTPADVGTDLAWERSRNKVTTKKVTTDTLGRFSLEGLLPGEYTLTIENQTIAAYVSAEIDPIVIELSSP